METKIERTLDWLQSNSFIQTIDKAGMAIDGCPLYYKQVKDNEFLVFAHYNSKKKRSIQGFDVFYFKRTNSQTIGKVKCELDNFRVLSFDIDRDLEELKTFITGKTDLQIL